MRASRIPCARCRRIATSWTTRWPRSSAPPRRKRASGCTGPPPTPGPSPRRDDRGARPRQGLRRGSRAGRPRPRCGRGRVFWLPRTERRRQDHDGPHPRHAAATHARERPHLGARRGAREPRRAEEHRAGVSGAHARPRPHGGGEPPLRRAALGPPGTRRPGAHRRAAAAVRARGAARLARARPLGRIASCGRHRARCVAPAARAVPRRADGGARSPGAARVVAVHPGPARGVGDDRVPDDALRGGGGAVRPRGRARSRSPRRPWGSGRAEARRRGGVARGGVSGAHRATARRGGRGGGPAGARPLAMARAVWGIVAREFVRFLRQRGRLVSSLARPFVWFVFAGAGFRALFAGPPGLDYPRYMAPGLLGMVVLFGAFLAALSTVTDRDAGVLRLLLVAPVPRGAVALGKALGATLLGTVQALAVALILLPAARLSLTLGGAALALAAVVLTSLAAGAVGLVLAATIRSIENFSGVMNFAIFPMLFLCGAFYPMRNLAAPLRALAYLNPIAYGVDLLKHALLAPWSAAGYGGELAVGFDFAALAIFAGLGLAAATPLLAREGGVTRAAFPGEWR